MQERTLSLVAATYISLDGTNMAVFFYITTGCHFQVTNSTEGFFLSMEEMFPLYSWQPLTGASLHTAGRHWLMFPLLRLQASSSASWLHWHWQMCFVPLKIIASSHDVPSFTFLLHRSHTLSQMCTIIERICHVCTVWCKNPGSKANFTPLLWLCYFFLSFQLHCPIAPPYHWANSTIALTTGTAQSMHCYASLSKYTACTDTLAW